MTTMQRMLRRICLVLAIAAVAIAALPVLSFAEAAVPAPNKGFATVREILDRSCSACHDWTTSYTDIIGAGKVVPGDPQKSALYLKIADDSMPAEGEKLTAEEKAFIRGWISAGAPSTDLPIAVSAVPATAPAPAGFLGFPSKVAFHEFSGFASGGLLLAAGVVGAVHFLDMMHQGHVYRDAINFQEGQPDAVRAPWVEQAWNDDQALRWWHVGFLVSGELLYLADAATGVSMIGPDTPGLTPQKIHRFAFFTHATLMAGQIALGFLTTDALSRGAHDTMIGLGAAHAAIGLAIPAVIIGAGVTNLLLFRTR